MWGLSLGRNTFVGAVDARPAVGFDVRRRVPPRYQSCPMITVSVKSTSQIAAVTVMSTSKFTI